jgi:hypothetical protein
MQIRLALATVLLLSSGSRLGAQPVPALAARLAGTVTDPYGPAESALVELLRGHVVLRAARAAADRRFEFDSVPHGAYQLRVRKLGLAAHEQPLRVSAPVEQVRVELRHASAIADSIRRAEYERRRALARARRRNWGCGASERSRRADAATAFVFFVGDRGDALSEQAREYGMATERRAFVRDFRPVSDARECRRLAEAIDRQYGLVNDRFRAYRVGRVYFLPEFGDSGMVVGLDGTILAVYIIPS